MHVHHRHTLRDLEPGFVYDSRFTFQISQHPLLKVTLSQGRRLSLDGLVTWSLPCDNFSHMFYIGRSLSKRNIQSFRQAFPRQISSSAIIMSPGRPFSGPIHWVLDWDGTLTKRDTLDALVNIAANCKPETPVGEEWKCVSEAYIKDYESTIKLHAPYGRLPSSRSRESTLLAVLEEVEQRSIDRVSESGIFEALTTTDLDNGAADAIRSGHVQLREGCGDFLQLVGSRLQQQEGAADAVSILSVNWSRRFILECLRAIREDFANMLSNSIYANELDGIQQGARANGRICAEHDMRFISSRDKVAHLELLRERTLRQGKPIPTVYVGDSWTDVESLLAADLGVCIRDDPMTSSQKKLADSLGRVGVPCARLRDMDGSAGVAWAEDFHELRRWMQKSGP
jgi:hypothetical protein